MNAIARQLTRITMIAAVLAAAFTTLGARAADRPLGVVQLQPAVVVGKRVRVIELERVVIVAKRQAPPAAVVAQRNARSPRG